MTILLLVFLAWWVPALVVSIIDLRKDRDINVLDLFFLSFMSLFGWVLFAEWLYNKIEDSVHEWFDKLGRIKVIKKKESN